MHNSRCNVYATLINRLWVLYSNMSMYLLTFSEAKKEKVNVLTHCNTGSLATGGYGTALGVIRALKELGHLSLAYCTETRPYNQGSRLTAYELVYEDIPAKLICDSAVSALMSTEVSTTTILVQ